MNREEYLRGLEEALTGEVSQAVIRDNVNYYGSYISQEMAKGRTVDEIVDEIGDPRIVAKTIIDSGEASGGSGAGDGYGNYRDASDGNSSGQSSMNGKHSLHYIDLNKWYWKLLLIIAGVLIVSAVVHIVGGIVALLLRFAGPILVVLLLVWFLRNLKR